MSWVRLIHRAKLEQRDDPWRVWLEACLTTGSMLVFGLRALAVSLFSGGRAMLDSLRRIHAQSVVAQTLQELSMPDGMFLVMQPIMSMAQPYASLNFEVLLRVRAENGAIVPPAELIATAEDSGCIALIDRWVLESVLGWMSANRHALGNTRFVCVNISGGSLNDDRFVEMICAMLDRHRAIAHFLCLEITEHVALRDLEHTQRFISRVHEMGAKVALDDFGAGQTSFRYLKALAFDVLKLDGTFVRTMCKHPADTAIVEALVSLARTLGMHSIAEWVEDVDTLRALKKIGVDYVQGFAIAKPQASDEILGVSSAAGFVESEEVARYIDGWGRSEVRMEFVEEEVAEAM